MCGEFKGEMKMTVLVNQKDVLGAMAMDMGMLWLMRAMDL